MKKYLIKILIKSRILLYNYLSNSFPILDGKIKIRQPVLFLGKGTIIFGKNNILGFYSSPNYWNGYSYIEARNEDAMIKIGSNNYFNNNLCVIAESSYIAIGNNCLFGINVEIINSDFHEISIKKRYFNTQKSKEVIIDDNVFIGNNVKIMKGVHIGENAVISNGSVVFDDVEKNTIVRGNPAIYYKTLYE